MNTTSENDKSNTQVTEPIKAGEKTEEEKKNEEVKLEEEKADDKSKD